MCVLRWVRVLILVVGLIYRVRAGIWIEVGAGVYLIRWIGIKLLVLVHIQILVSVMIVLMRRRIGISNMLDLRLSLMLRLIPKI